MKYNTFIGIDPGVKGGISVIKAESLTDFKIYTYKMPPIDLDLLTLLNSYGENSICFLEKVHSQPIQGVRQAFTFGMNLGKIKMALCASKIPFKEVTPQTWLQSFNLKKRKNETKTQWKNRLKQRAIEFFPSEKVILDTADAILISQFCFDSHK